MNAYRPYMQLEPDDPDPYYGLGQTLKALGDVPGAIEAFRKYVAMEKRPEEQRWVDKARAELEALEAMQKRLEAGGARSRERDRRRARRKTNAHLDRDWARCNPFPTTGRATIQRAARSVRQPKGARARVRAATAALRAMARRGDCASRRRSSSIGARSPARTNRVRALRARDWHRARPTRRGAHSARGTRSGSTTPRVEAARRGVERVRRGGADRSEASDGVGAGFGAVGRSSEPPSRVGERAGAVPGVAREATSLRPSKTMANAPAVMPSAA